jgi:glycerate-2-kinase
LQPGTQLEGPAEEIGVQHARLALHMLPSSSFTCVITGGEPTVKLAPPELRGKGGRNQQLVLAAMNELTAHGAAAKVSQSPAENVSFCLLSGGTDGEDGPTDAAGAVMDEESLVRARELNLDPADYLRRNDAYSFFHALGCLLKTGPTHTNVCDVRIILVGPR